MKNIFIFLFVFLSVSCSIAQTIVISPGAELNVINNADICAQNGNISGNLTGNGSQCGIAMPVKLTSYFSTVNKNYVNIFWITETEINNSGFDIEKKFSGGDWQKIGFANGNGTTQSQKKYTFTDLNQKAGKYNYRLKQIDYNGNFTYYQLPQDITIIAPVLYTISQNYPNPFNPITKIDFEIPENAKIILSIFDITGRLIATPVNGKKEAGYYSVDFDGSNLSSGVYFYKIEAGKYAAVKKMILLK